MYRGILTGLNDSFVIDRVTKINLIKEDPRSAEIIKPFLAGKDVKRYMPLNHDVYLILFPKGFTNIKGNNPKNPWKWLGENYSAVAKHLKPFQERGCNRTDKGDYWWELRACEYYNQFESSKIVWPETSSLNNFTWDETKLYLNKTSFFIPTSDKVLLGILNSKVSLFILDKICGKVRGGYLMLSKQYVEKLPILYPTGKTIEELLKMVNQIFSLNKENEKQPLQKK
jgi:hypothetical protein